MRQPARQDGLGDLLRDDSTLRGAGDQTSNLPVTTQRALPPELLPPQYVLISIMTRREQKEQL